MISTGHFLASDLSLRQPSIMSSNAGALGLGLGSDDVIKHDLVARSSRSELGYTVERQTLAEQLFQALVDAKVWTSQVAMRLDLDARNRFFRQLDLLHDCDEWLEGDHPAQLGSYKSFIRFMLAIGGQSKPAIALTHTGQLLAIWTSEGNRLTLTFENDDRLRWIVSCSDGDRAAGVTALSRIGRQLEPYTPQRWFAVG